MIAMGLVGMAKSKTKPDQRGQVQSIKDEAHASRAILESVRDILGPDAESMKLDIVEGETSLYEAMGAALERLATVEAFEAGLAQAISNMQARKQRFKEQGELIRAAMHMALDTIGEQTLELPMATVTAGKLADALDIKDEADIPSTYWVNPAPTLDKKTLLSDLKGGQQVAGAGLIKDRTTLTVRFK